MGPRTRSLLPRILSSVGPLPVFRAPIEHASIYVAPPDKHLIVPRDQVHLSIGPKEQHHRPCINVTFCSAALAFGDRVAR